MIGRIFILPTPKIPQKLSRILCFRTRAYARGGFGVKTPLELDILQKLYYLRKEE